MLLLRKDLTSGLQEYYSSPISTSWRKNIFLRVGISFINRKVKVAVCSSFYHLRDSCHAVGLLDALCMLYVLVFNAYFELKQKIRNFGPNVYSVTKVSSLANQSSWSHKWEIYYLRFSKWETCLQKWEEKQRKTPEDRPQDLTGMHPHTYA